MKSPIPYRVALLLLILPFAGIVSATDYCEKSIGRSSCKNVVSMVGDGVQKTSVIFETYPQYINKNFNITGIPVCFTISTTDTSLVVNWNSSDYYEQYAGSINATLFYNNTPTSGECSFTFRDGNGKNVCDSQAPLWSEEPVFAYASDRMAVFNVSVTDNIGVTGFIITFNGCEETKVQVAATKDYTGTIAVPLPDGCPDITTVATTATIVATDAKENISEEAVVEGVVKTDSQPVMVSAECQPNYLKNSVVLAVESQKGSSDVKKYRVKDESAGVDRTIDGGESCTITVDNIDTDHSFVFKVWAVDEKGFESANFIKCELNCITTSEPAIITNIKTSYIARGSSVIFTAVGFDAGGTFEWARTDNPSGTWTTLQETSNILVDYPMYAGNNFYKVTSTVNGDPVTVQTSLLAKVACDVEGSAIQKQVWIESFDDPVLYPFSNIDHDRFECPHIVDYEFATWDNPCGEGEGFQPGKVCDGSYVVVAKSNAAYPASCGWPVGRFDHTSGDGSSGYLIVNLGEERRLIYEQEIKPEGGFCSGVFYNFSLFATNIAPNGCPARFAFDIIKVMETDSVYLVKEYDSGAIEGYNMSKWYEYGVSFEVNDIENVQKIILRLWNTGNCGYGNDVVIDDISVSVCSPIAQAFIGDPAEGVKEVRNIDCGESVDLNATVKGYIGDFFSSTPYYVWQKSLDNGSTWSVIDGEHTDKFIYLTDESESAKFRCLIASDKATADLVLRGTSETGCGLYSWSDLLSVKCVKAECGYITLVAEYPSGSSADKYMVGAGDVKFTVLVSSGVTPSSYFWYVNDKQVATTTDALFLRAPYVDEKISVSAVRACNSDELTIKVEWPTIVAPYDANGLNDSFAEGFDANVMLFDRSGNMVYNGQDGVPASVLSTLQPTVYYYTAKLPDGSVRKGTLEVFKK